MARSLTLRWPALHPAADRRPGLRRRFQDRPYVLSSLSVFLGKRPSNVVHLLTGEGTGLAACVMGPVALLAVGALGARCTGGGGSTRRTNGARRPRAAW